MAEKAKMKRRVRERLYRYSINMLKGLAVIYIMAILLSVGASVLDGVTGIVGLEPVIQITIIAFFIAIIPSGVAAVTEQ